MRYTGRMMVDFFCPYRGIRVPSEGGTAEHVVPRALGGSDEFSVTVERKANNDLGSEVDAPMIDFYSERRIKFDLRGHKRREPAFSSDVLVEGRPATWEMGPDSGGVRLKTVVTKTPMPNGTIQVSISGDPEKVRRIAAAIQRSHEAKGKLVAPFVETATVLEQPQVTGTFRCDTLALGRFQSKLALGLGHWLWGEEWSSGAGASALRRSLWSRTIEELDANAQNDAAISPADLGLRAQENEHLFVAVPAPDRNGGMAFALFLFGQVGYVLTASEPGPATERETTAVVLDVTTRRVRRLTLDEMLAEGRVDRERRDSPAP